MKLELSEQEIENSPDYMPIVGYERLYEVDNDGRVWSLNYHHTGERKQLRLTPHKHGYLYVTLYKDSRRKTIPVHQLVLNAYLPKPSPELEVLHKNSTPADNRLKNLKWGLHKENLNDQHRIDLMIEVMTNHPANSVPVFCVETGVVYPSVSEASRQTTIAFQNISKCLNGKRKTAGGFHWAKFVEGVNPIYE